jgi:DNA polymerase delta subunit 1
MTTFQAVAWDGQDEDDQFVVRIFGRTEGGKSVSLGTPFCPYFYIKSHNPVDLRDFIRSEYRGLKSCEVTQGKDLWGFQNGELTNFVKCEFRTHRALRGCAYSIESKCKGAKNYESNIDPVLRFMHCSGISSTGWIRPEVCEPDVGSSCDLNYWVPIWQNVKPVARDDLAPLRIMSFDIECYSSTGAFPDPRNPNDVIFQIGMTTKAFGSDAFLDRTCLCFKETDGHPSFATERELLEAFQKHLIKVDPDIITGWNIFGFDLEFLHMRAVRNGVSTVWGRREDYPVEDVVTKNLSSSALGSNLLKMTPMKGRYVFDLFQDVKREHKLESYSLNNVSKHFLKDSQKHDMPVREIFASFAAGDPKRLGQVAEYCLQDTVLPHKLMEKLCQIQNQVEMAKACWVPLAFLSERGQQIKVFSQMAKKARELNFIIPTFRVPQHGFMCDVCNKNIPEYPCPSCDYDGVYKGATVLDAQTGAYYGPITALDFASLYPSIMCAHNLCYSSLVMDPKYANVPGVTYEEFKVNANGQSFRFAQGTTSLLPTILMDLKAFRKKAKKLMAQAEGTPMEAVYNGQQLAYKISMNSIYGFTGASKGMLPLVAIASTVTFRGRQMIDETKTYVEANFPGAKVRYGDSVMPETPVLVKMNGVFGPMKIENLANKWEEYSGFLKEGTNKESSEVAGAEAWTHKGWQPIKRVIRHKCSKKIYRVLTHTGLVDVTEDHSLLGPGVELLKPKDVMVGQKLLHSFPPIANIENVKSLDSLFVIGMFVGDGSCGSYQCPSGRKSTWCINNQDLGLLEKCKTILETMYPDYGFVIMDTLQSSGVYKLGPRGNVVKLVTEWRAWCYDGQAKKIPEFVFSSSDAKQAFLKGLWASDGCRRYNETGGCHRIDTKNQVTAQWYYLLLTSMNYNVSLNTRADKTNVFRLTWTESSFRKDPTAMKKISVLHESWDGYVYDLETAAGTFQAGVGKMIVKNTDSVMVEFDVQGRKGQEAIDYSWELGEQASEQCTKLFKAPNDLELEKIYCPYFLYSKKRYAAKMFEKNKEGQVAFKKIDVKGLQVVRRDSCPFVRETLKTLLAQVLDSNDPRPVVETARSAARELLDGSVPIEKLLMSKQLGSDYKVPMAHVAVRDKIRKRSPGSEPQQGDRVSFLITKGPGKMYEKAEDPAWVQEHRIPVDFEYYFTNQFKKPVQDLLEPLISADQIFTKKFSQTRGVSETDAKRAFLARFALNTSG